MPRFHAFCIFDVETKIYVPPPDDASREQIFRIELSKVPVGDDVNFTRMAELTAGFSGAEVSSVCTEAAMLAMDRIHSSPTSVRSEELVNNADLEMAINLVELQITPKMLSYYSALEKKFSR